MSNQRKQQPEKISADCPHCGFSQLESAYAKSTICRRCSQPFSIEKLLAKEVSSLKPPSFFDKIGKLISRETIREVSCFSCHHTQQVSSAAESSLCPKCGSYIDLRDFKITGPFGRSIQTQGEVIITDKGDATSQRILCGRAWIEGKMRGHLLCTDTVSLKAQCKIMGAIEADKVVVEKKCDAELTRPTKARSIEVNGKVTGDFFIEGKVTINKHGYIIGNIYARSIVIEKGGSFYGELHIGELPVEAQPEVIVPEEPITQQLGGEPVPQLQPQQQEAPAPAAPSIPAAAATPTEHLPGLEPQEPAKPGQRLQRPTGGFKPKTRRVASK